MKDKSPEFNYDQKNHKIEKIIEDKIKDNSKELVEIKENTVENPTIARVSKVASLTSVKIID